MIDLVSVYIDCGHFAWDYKDEVFLENINLKIPHGHLVAVVGYVGSGKSSLISAIMGEMEKIRGRVNTVVSFHFISNFI